MPCICAKHGTAENLTLYPGRDAVNSEGPVFGGAPGCR